ncbi:MAG: nucleotide exchange factor GrpE [Sandaracinus sp.]|nr:nucleotide exchange factor GrpE [Sandaracinus sp.]
MPSAFRFPLSVLARDFTPLGIPPCGRDAFRVPLSAVRAGARLHGPCRWGSLPAVGMRSTFRCPLSVLALDFTVHAAGDPSLRSGCVPRSAVRFPCWRSTSRSMPRSRRGAGRAGAAGSEHARRRSPSSPARGRRGPSCACTRAGRKCSYRASPRRPLRERGRSAHPPTAPGGKRKADSGPPRERSEREEPRRPLRERGRSPHPPTAPGGMRIADSGPPRERSERAPRERSERAAFSLKDSPRRPTLASLERDVADDTHNDPQDDGHHEHEDITGPQPHGEDPAPKSAVAEAKDVVDHADPPAELEVDVEALIAEREQLKDRLLRVAADFDNFRKRAKRELEDTKKRAREDAFRDFLPVVDDLERAVAASGQAKDAEAVAEGVRMVLRGFQERAERMGLERVKAVGAQFDPNLHDAVQQHPTDEHPPGTVVAEVVPGYTMQGRLLRAAMVVVARPPSDE